MANEINKPVTVVRQEFISALTQLCNGSKLPPFVLEPILKDFYTDMKLLAQRQLENDLKNYQEAQAAHEASIRG